MSADNPMRVLLVTPTQGRYGGLEAVVLALAQSLVETAEFSPRICFKLVRGAEFTDSLRKQGEATGAPYTVVERGSRELRDNLRWAQVVHAHNPSPDVVFGARFCGRPVLLTVINHRSGSRSLRALSWDLGVKLANARCYISDFVRSTWEPRGLQPNSQVMPAIPRLPDLPVTWQRSGFFFIGRWIENKGIEELLKAYASAKIDHAAWPLTLGGNGPLRPWVEEFVRAQKLSTVQLAGFVSEAEKFFLLGRAKWNVAPPHTKEDLGLTPIEARHLAVPSIITRDGGLPEAAGPEALVAEPADVESLRAQLETAAAMPEDEYRRRALASQAQLQKFLRPLTDYHALYRQLAK